MNPSVLLSTVVCGLLAVPAVASAQDQPWLKDRRYTEGPGYRVGDFEIHPGAALEFGYDSNYLRRSSASPDGDTLPPLQSLRLRLTPSLSFSTLGAQRRETAPSTSQPSVEFRGGLSLTYNEFIPLNAAPAGTPSISSQRNVGGTADLALGILPGRPWSGLLSASYSRILTASSEGSDVSFSSQGTLNRDVPRVGAELIWTPGAGLLEWRLGYQFSATLFESTNVGNLTNLQNQIETRGRWRFLPRTSMLFDGRFGFINYPNAAPTGGGIVKSSSHPVHALIGINGLVTPSFALMAMVGWGASFYSQQQDAVKSPIQDFDSVIGQAEVKWYLTPNPSADPAAASLALSSISLGFVRDFYDNYLGYYFERDRGYATLSYFYGGRFLIILDGGAGPLLYPKLPAIGATSPFTMIRVDASLFGEYRFKDFFGINATVRYNDNIGDQVITPAAGGMSAHLSYREIEAYLGARWLM
jgi:hypothetical protein